MSAQIVPFTRNMNAELQKLTTFYKQPTVGELLDRHEKMRLILIEAYDLMRAGRVKPEYLRPMTFAFDGYHNVCSRAGVELGTIEEFNRQRGDWKRYDEALKSSGLA